MPPRLPDLLSYLPAALALAVAVAVHLGLLHALDLRDHAGVAGCLMLRDLATDSTTLGWPGRLGTLAVPFLGPYATARVLGGLATVGAAVGAMLLAGRVANRGAAALAGLLVALWSPAASTGWQVGPDTLSWGLGWLGVGVAWVGVGPLSRRGPTVAVLGTGLVVLAAGIKVSALPLVGLALLAPLLVEGTWRERFVRLAWVGGTAAVAAPVVWFGMPANEPVLAGLPVGAERPGLLGRLDLWTGLRHLLSLRTSGNAQGSFSLMLVCAVPGGFLPGPHRVARGLIWTLTAGLLLSLARVLGEGILPRYLLPATLGLPVLLAVGLDALGRFPRLRGAGWLGVAAVAAIFALDTLAYASAWADQRVPLLGTAPADLPPAPAPFRSRYATLSRATFQDASHGGILEFQELARTAPIGVATIHLRDRREAHGHVAAVTTGRSFETVLPQVWCKNAPVDAACAEACAGQVAWRGLTLVLPANPEGLGEEERAWTDLFAAAMTRIQGEPARSAWWLVWGPPQPP